MSMGAQPRPDHERSLCNKLCSFATLSVYHGVFGRLNTSKHTLYPLLLQLPLSLKCSLAFIVSVILFGQNKTLAYGDFTDKYRGQEERSMWTKGHGVELTAEPGYAAERGTGTARAPRLFFPRSPYPLRSLNYLESPGVTGIILPLFLRGVGA